MLSLVKKIISNSFITSFIVFTPIVFINKKKDYITILLNH